jgi:hypothetical protein
MSHQGASARMEAQIPEYLQEQAQPAMERKQQKSNQKEVVWKAVVQMQVQKKVEQTVVVAVSSCRLFKLLLLSDVLVVCSSTCQSNHVYIVH